jgi:hypothetical protein
MAFLSLAAIAWSAPQDAHVSQRREQFSSNVRRQRHESGRDHKAGLVGPAFLLWNWFVGLIRIGKARMSEKF